MVYRTALASLSEKNFCRRILSSSSPPFISSVTRNTDRPSSYTYDMERNQRTLQSLNCSDLSWSGVTASGLQKLVTPRGKTPLLKACDSLLSLIWVSDMFLLQFTRTNRRDRRCKGDTDTVVQSSAHPVYSVISKCPILRPAPRTAAPPLSLCVCVFVCAIWKQHCTVFRILSRKRAYFF